MHVALRRDVTQRDKHNVPCNQKGTTVSVDADDVEAWN